MPKPTDPAGPEQQPGVAMPEMQGPGGVGSAGIRGGSGEAAGATSGMSDGETTEAMPGGTMGSREQPGLAPADR